MNNYYRIYLQDNENGSGMAPVLVKGPAEVLEPWFNALGIIFKKETLYSLEFLTNGDVRMIEKDVNNLTQHKNNAETLKNHMEETFLTILEKNKV